MKPRFALIALCAGLAACGGNGDDNGNGGQLPVLSIAATNASQPEGNSGTTSFTFTVTRAGDTSGASSVNWAVSSTQADGADFSGGALPSGSLSFAAGEASKQIGVGVAGDTAVESDESFTVTLSGVSGAALGTALANGTILNDDTPSQATPLGATNYEAVALEGIVPIAFLMESKGLILGARAGTPNVLFSFSRAQLESMPRWFASAPPSVIGAIVTGTEPCAWGGSINYSIDDVNNNYTVDVGESVTIVAAGCIMEGGALIDGTMSLVITSMTGTFPYPYFIEPYQLTATMTFSTLMVQSGLGTETANGTFTLSADVQAVNAGTYVMTVPDLSITATYDSETVTRTLIDYTITSVDQYGPSTLTAGGKIQTSVLPGNELTVQTTEPLWSDTDDLPSIGEMLITAAEGGKVRVTVLNNNEVRFELDADDDGFYELSETWNWSELL